MQVKSVVDGGNLATKRGISVLITYTVSGLASSLVTTTALIEQPVRVMNTLVQGHSVVSYGVGYLAQTILNIASLAEAGGMTFQMLSLFSA